MVNFRLPARRMSALPSASVSAKVARARASRLRRGGATIGAIPTPPRRTRPDAPPRSVHAHAVSTTTASRKGTPSLDAVITHAHQPFPRVYVTHVARHKSVMDEEEDDEEEEGALESIFDGLSEGIDKGRCERDAARRRGRGGAEDVRGEDVSHADAVRDVVWRHGTHVPLVVSQWCPSAALTLAPVHAVVRQMGRWPGDAPAPSALQLFSRCVSPCAEEPLARALASCLTLSDKTTAAMRATYVSRDVRRDTFSPTDVRHVRAFSTSLGQRVPALVALAETPRCVETDAAEIAMDVVHWRSPDSRVLPLPALSVPTEVMRQRIHLSAIISAGPHPQAISPLARALRRAGRELRRASWCPTQTAAHAQYIWNGTCWLLEEDTQLVAAEEEVIHGESSPLCAWLPPCGSAALLPHAFVHATMTWWLPKCWRMTGLHTFLSTESGTRLARSHTQPRRDVMRHDDDNDNNNDDDGEATLRKTGKSDATQRLWTGALTAWHARDALCFPSYDAVTGWALSSPRFIALAHPLSSPRHHFVSRHRLFRDAGNQALGTNAAETNTTGATNPFSLSAATQRIGWWPLSWLAQTVTAPADGVHTGACEAAAAAADSDGGVHTPHLHRRDMPTWYVPHRLPWPLLSDRGLRAHSETKTGAPPPAFSRRSQQKTQTTRTRCDVVDAVEAASATVMGETNRIGFFANSPPRWFMDELAALHLIPRQEASDEATASAVALRAFSRLLQTRCAMDTEKVIWNTPKPRPAHGKRTPNVAKTEVDDENLIWVLVYSPWDVPIRHEAPETKTDGVEHGGGGLVSVLQWHVHSVADGALLNFVYALAETLAEHARTSPLADSHESESCGDGPRSCGTDWEAKVARSRVFIDVCAALFLLASLSAQSGSHTTPLHAHLQKQMTAFSASREKPCAGQCSGTGHVNALVDAMTDRCVWSVAEYDAAMRKANSCRVEESRPHSDAAHSDPAVAITVGSDGPEETGTPSAPPMTTLSLDDGGEGGEFVVRLAEESDAERNALPALDRRPNDGGRRLVEPEPLPQPTSHLAQAVLFAHETARHANRSSSTSILDEDRRPGHDGQSEVWTNDVDSLSEHSGHVQRLISAEVERSHQRWDPWRRHVSAALPVTPSPLSAALTGHAGTAAISSQCMGLSIVTLSTVQQYVNASNVLVGEPSGDEEPD